MPNWCDNRIVFEESGVILAPILNTFKAMQALEKSSKKGQKIPGLNMESWLYEITVYTFDEYITFETKWGTEFGDIEKISRHFNVEFKLDYEESIMGIYGQMLYKNGVLANYVLDNDDTAVIQFDDDEEFIPIKLDGYIVDNETEAREILLDQKIKACTPS